MRRAPALAAGCRSSTSRSSQGEIDATGTEAGLEREQTTTDTNERQEKLSLSTNADQEASIDYRPIIHRHRAIHGGGRRWLANFLVAPPHEERPRAAGRFRAAARMASLTLVTVTDGGKVQRVEGRFAVAPAAGRTGTLPATFTAAAGHAPLRLAIGGHGPND